MQPLHPSTSTTVTRAALAALAALALLSVPAAADHNPDDCIEGGIEATANDDGSVTLTWTEYGEDEYTVERRTGGGAWQHMAVVSGDETWTDTSTTGGATYQYQVESMPGARGERYLPYCAEVTAVPFFGAPVLGALAVVGALGAYAWMRRA